MRQYIEGRGIMVTKIHWDSTDLASQALVDAMIEDIGLDDDDADERVKKASRVYALSLLGADCMEMGDWQLMVGCFAEGYEQALVDMGKREPDGTNTFRD